MASHRRRYESRARTTTRRAHAALAPGARRVDALAADPLGRARPGPATGRLVAEILRSRPHPEQGYRACLGIMRLGRRYGAERLEAACRARRAPALLQLPHGQEHPRLGPGPPALRRPRARPPAPTPAHDNIRGASYYAARGGEPNADPTDAGQDERHEALGDGRGLRATARLGRARQAELRGARRAAGRRRVDRPRAAQADPPPARGQAALPRPRSRTSTSSTPAASTASRCSAWAAAAGSRTATTC